MRICMLAYTFYESDNRVRRYAETLVKRGDHVDAIVLRREGQPEYERVNGINVFRIQRRVVNERARFTYLYRLLRFFVISALFLAKLHLKKRYDLIHVHSVPDFEVFAALLAKITGAKVILDIHDIVPEFYASKFKVSKKSLVFKMMVAVEKASIAFSDHVIIANHLWKEKLVTRSVNEAKCSVVLNYPDPSLFYVRERKRYGNKFIIVYPGTIAWHQGVDIAVKAFTRIKDAVPEAEFHIYGEGSEAKTLQELIYRLHMEERVVMKGDLPIDQIALVMADADLGIVPKRADSFGDEAFSTKTLEFMALGVPLIVSNTSVDRYYFNDSLVMFFESGDDRALADCMMKMIRNAEIREHLKKNALAYIERNNWGLKGYEYLNLVDTLTGRTSNVPQRA